MSAVGEHNIGFQMESLRRPVEQPYDGVYNRLNRAIQNEDPVDRNNVQAPKIALVMVQETVLYIMATIVVLSFFATIATLILVLTMLTGGGLSTCSSPDRTEDRVGRLLVEIKDSLKENYTQPLADVKAEIRELKANLSRDFVGSCLFSKVKKELCELKEEMHTVKQNLSGVSGVSKNCAQVHQSGYRSSGLYKIDPDGLGEFQVFCDLETDGGGWTVLQKRQDGSVDFYRGWHDYKHGFGFLNGEFWLGLDKIHRLTKSGNHKLRFDLELHHETAFAEYSFFAVSNETEQYKLSVAGYSGTAGDSFTYHRYQAFTTKDRDNDFLPVNCAVKDQGAWWYKDCYQSNLNGLYLNGTISGQGVVWYSWKNSYISAARAEMKVRPKDFSGSVTNNACPY